MSTETKQRALPPDLMELPDLALDLRWTGSQFAGRLWERLDAEGWERTRNAHTILLNCHQSRLDDAAGDEAFKAELRAWLERRHQYQNDPGWFGRQHADSKLSCIAYFSMEFGLSEALPIYSGGLGILAGDHLKSASDLGVPLVGVGLLYQQGYFRQVLAPDGTQLEAFPFNDPGSLPVRPAIGPDGSWPRIHLELPGRTLLLRVWEARVGKVRLYLLDSNDPMNSPWDRGITANLYAAGKDKRLLQEIVLGIGGWSLLEEMQLTAEVCHLNEGHAAFAILARALSFARRENVPFPVALRVTRAGNVFTTHTPVAAAFDQFEPGMLQHYGGPFIQMTGVPADELLALGRQNPRDRTEPFKMAYLAMRGSGSVNGVSQLHGQVSQRLFSVLFPGRPLEEVPVGAITNGVHVPTWDSPMANELWSKAHPQARWVDNLEAAATTIVQVDPITIWDFRAKARHSLVLYVRRRLARQLRERGASQADIERAAHILDPNTLTLGFARRFTAYKRPNLLLHNLGRLGAILNHPTRPVQLLVAGKAHPNDEHGKSMVKAFAQVALNPAFRDRVVFLEDYEMVLAQNLAAGVDVWINNPVRPAEACGTSGMKVLVNGGLHLSVLDGWWAEAYAPEVGWQIGDGSEQSGPERDHEEANQLYDRLEREIAPLFYQRDADNVPRGWIEKVRASMSRLTPRFSSDRMVREYVERAYLPAVQAYRRRAADHASLAKALEAWHNDLQKNWLGMRFGDIRVHEEDGCWCFDVQAYLGELPLEDVRVELYASSLPPVQMTMNGPIPGAINGYNLSAKVPNHRAAADYTPRIVPAHAEALSTLETLQVYWQK